MTEAQSAADARAEERRWRRKRKRGERRRASRRRAASALRAVRAVVGRLPMPVACALGHALGNVAYLVGGRARRQAHANLDDVLAGTPRRERRRIARRSFALAARGIAAFLVAHRMGRERARRYLTVEGEEHVRAALATGKGPIAVSFHFGCFEFLDTWVSEFRGCYVSRETDEDGPNALLFQMRRDLGVETIERGQVRELLGAIRDARPVGMLIDQDTDDVNGVFVPFFGKLAYTAPGAAALALRLGAPLIMFFVEWEGLTRHRVRVLPMLEPRKDLSRDEAALELTARMTRIGEEEVRRRPDHWVWMHRRWQTRPEDKPDCAVWREETR